MALNKDDLKKDIKKIISDMRGKEDNADEIVAGQLAEAIDKYIKKMTITVPAGITVSTAGSPAAQTGTTTAPATATIS